MELLVKKKAKSAANTCIADLKPKQLQVQAVLCSFRFIFQIKIFHIKLLQRMITSTYSKDLIVLEVLNLSQTRCHQDVTLNCSNGTVHSNSFLLASIFPVVRRALETTIQYQDPVLILIPDPDMDIIELQTFLLHLREVCLFEDLADIGNYYDRDTNIKSDSKIPCEHCGTLWNTKNFRKDKSFRRPHE